MGGTEGIRVVPISAVNPADTLTRLLINGAVLRGRISTDGTVLSLIVAGQRIPLPKSVALPAGTPVEVRVTQENGTPQLLLQTLESGSPATASPRPPAPNLAELLQTPSSSAASAKPITVAVPTALKGLLEPAQAAALLPNAASIPPKAIEALLTTLVARSDIGRALEQLGAFLEADVAAGRLPDAAVAPLRAAIDAFNAASPEEFRRAVEVAREALGTRADRAASTPSAEDTSLTTARDPRASPEDPRPVPRGLIDELGRVRDELTVRAASISTTRATGETLKAIDSLTSRLNADGLQNIRTFDTPYQFFAIPFAPRTGIEHAQVHLLGSDGRGAGASRRAHLVAIDLHLTQLGPLWITIQSAGPACSCIIRAEHDIARRALDAGAPALEAGLRRAGFPTAQVRTEPWDGDRAQAAAALFALPQRFEANA